MRMRDAALVIGAVLVGPTLAGADPAERRIIEEVVVTAEKRESTVSDTALTITAFDEDFLEDMGIASPDEMVNFIPATTRDDYDIRIRGIGRNFRAAGGDAGVATYYNGVYSPDFGIAATENALYDLERVEVLRGPQGTLYGRNSIGGAINYVTKDPTFDWQGEVLGIVGKHHTREWFAVLSGPIIDEVLAFRLQGSLRDRDGAIPGVAGTPDLETVNDQNWVLTLKWQPRDDLVVKLRGNERRSLRNLGIDVRIEEGPLAPGVPRTRIRDNSFYVHGFRPVDEGTPNAIAFVSPAGAVRWGARNRPGVDPVTWPFAANTAFGTDDVLQYDAGKRDEPKLQALTNGIHDEEFDHMAGSLDVTWDVSDTMTLKYIFGYQNFVYWFDRDFDHSNGTVASWGDTVIEDVDSNSHELQLLWQWGERLIGTSGLFRFFENRLQHYGLRNRLQQGYINEPADYGALAPIIGGFMPDCFSFWNDTVLGFDGFGRWCGDDGKAHSHTNDIGAAYEHRNTVDNTAYAAYTQVDYLLTDAWTLTLGVRWARDEREAYELRGGYSEIEAPWLVVDPSIGFAGLAAVNVLMGNATLTGNPEDPIVPVCDLTAPECANPLRLGGIPIGWGSRLDGEDDWSDVDWRANVTWEPTDDVLLYAGVTTGYRAGGYSLGVTDARDFKRDELGFPIPGPLELSTYDEEKVYAYQAGYKGLHRDGTLRLEGAVYMYDYEDNQDQVEQWDPIRQQTVDVVTNVPSIVNWGIELDAMWLPTDRLMFGGNYSYTISEYDDDVEFTNLDDPRYPSTVFGLPVGDNPNDAPPDILDVYVRNVKGVQIKGIPKHKGTLWGSFRWATDRGTFDVYTSVSVTGEYFTHEFSREFDRVPQRERWDARVTWRDVVQRWKVSLFVDNILDKAYLRSVSVGDQNSNFAQTGVPLYPRFWGLEVTRYWGPR